MSSAFPTPGESAPDARLRSGARPLPGTRIRDGTLAGMATKIDPDSTLGALVNEVPARARVFEDRNLDYCCGGSRTLRAACEAAGASLDGVIAELEAAAASDPAAATPGDAGTSDGWAGMGIGALAGHIVDLHHTYLKREFPRISEMADKVVNAHGEHHPEVLEVRSVYTHLREELEEHLQREERALFPWIQQLAAAVTIEDIGVSGVDGPISCMFREHDDAAIALGTLRSLTRDFSPPADACPTFIAFYDALRELEGDIHMHIHKENNLLFGKVLAREQALVDAAEAAGVASIES